MSLDFDQFPVDDPIADKDTGSLTWIWMGSLATFWETLVTYLTSGGIIPPSLTRDQRDALQNLQNGQTIYNVTDDVPQFYQVSTKTWRTYTFT